MLAYDQIPDHADLVGVELSVGKMPVRLFPCWHASKVEVEVIEHEPPARFQELYRKKDGKGIGLPFVGTIEEAEVEDRSARPINSLLRNEIGEPPVVPEWVRDSFEFVTDSEVSLEHVNAHGGIEEKVYCCDLSARLGRRSGHDTARGTKSTPEFETRAKTIRDDAVIDIVHSSFWKEEDARWPAAWDYIAAKGF